MRRTWTSEEEQILRRYYRREKAIGVQKRIPYRSVTCIRSKAYNLGLYFHQHLFPRKYWTTRELNILDRFYPIEGFACGKRLPKRTKAAIFAMPEIEIYHNRNLGHSKKMPYCGITILLKAPIAKNAYRIEVEMLSKIVLSFWKKVAFRGLKKKLTSLKIIQNSQPKRCKNSCRAELG